MKHKKLIFNRNVKQLKKIILNKIDERIISYNKYDPTGQNMIESKVLDGKVSILSWVLQVLDNPKEWDNDIMENLNDDEIFSEVV